MNSEQDLNKPHNQQLNIAGVSSSTVIEPINCELSESMKAHIEMMEWVNENFHKNATKMLMIPKDMFGRK
jgi:hypothetical protein